MVEFAGGSGHVGLTKKYPSVDSPIPLTFAMYTFTLYSIRVGFDGNANVTSNAFRPVTVSFVTILNPSIESMTVIWYLRDIWQFADSV